MIRIDRVSKVYGKKEVLINISLEIPRGGIFTLIGPSGSGKTTLLRLIDMLDFPTAGSIIFDGINTTAEQSHQLAIRRRIGMVFQKPIGLNTTVAENVAFGLRFRGIHADSCEIGVRSALELVGLGHCVNRRATTLSGGEMQRVAIARAMVTEPEVLLLDEPTANLDPLSSTMIENLIGRINRDLQTTVIMSTHDMIQGQRLADRAAMIIDGRIAQAGCVNDIFHTPTGESIARFVGFDAGIPGVVESYEGGMAVISAGTRTFETASSCTAGRHVRLYIRPEEVTLSIPHEGMVRTSVRNRFDGMVTRIVPYGQFVRVTVDCGFVITALITRRSCTELGLSVGSRAIAAIKATAIHVLPDEETTAIQ